MPRIARVVLPDVPYHITQRGNYRQDVFEDQQDKEFYMELFMYYAKEHGLKLYAWCLMDNHVHFVVEPSTETTLAKVFNTVHMRYSQYFNKKKGVRGHLWQGRFFSCPLDKEHLYEAIRYVELNPVRANIVSQIENYEWSSSYNRLCGDNRFPLHSIKGYLEIDNWKEYLKEAMNDDVIAMFRSNTKTGRPSGGAHFVSKIEKLTGRSFSIRRVGRPKIQK
jgi:putative transposase